MYEINKEIVFSTSHIPTSVADMLENVIGQRAINNYDDDFDMVILADSDRCRILIDPEANVMGVLKNLVEIALDNNCKWLILDYDGPVYENLETFDWS